MIITNKKEDIIEEVIRARNNRETFFNDMKIAQQIKMKVARQCANLLKTKFGVKKVILFGSLLDYREMNYNSDIDLAVLGLSEKKLWLAGALLEKNHDFNIDLVEIEKAKSHIIESIKKGIEL